MYAALGKTWVTLVTIALVYTLIVEFKGKPRGKTVEILDVTRAQKLDWFEGSKLQHEV